MPVLPNPRQEKFAQELAKGASVSDAYEKAGFKRHRQNASRLMSNDDVRARVDELTAAAAEKAVLTKAWVIERLMTNAERALQHEAVKDSEGRETGEFTYEGHVANRALELLGKEIGMFVDRTENVNFNHDVSDEPFSDEEWEARYATEH